MPRLPRFAPQPAPRVPPLPGARRSASRGLQNVVGDPWSVRRSKQIVREISAWRATRGLTTDELAKRCTAWLGDTESPVTTAWLNSLFAGKRKGLSFSEIEMFAAVLRVNLLELIYPAGELVEVQPEWRRKSVECVISAAVSSGDRQKQRVLDALLIDKKGWDCWAYAWDLPEAPSDREVWGLTSRVEEYFQTRSTYELRYQEEPPSIPSQLARFFSFVAQLELSPDDESVSTSEKMGALRAYLADGG